MRPARRLCYIPTSDREGFPMRILLLTTVVACLFAPSVGAQTEPALPAGAEALEARLMTRVGPQTRSWIRKEAARQHAAGNASETVARNAIKADPLLGSLPDGDINALVFLVMMEASKSARDDLKAIMNGVKKINEAKASLRKNENAKAATVPRQTTTASRPLVQPKPIPKAQFEKQLQSAKNDLDSLSEMGEMESLRLQAAMDNSTKANSAASNAMKKFSATSQSISQNLK